MKRILSVLSVLLGSILQAQTLTSSNLPIIVINTNGQEIVDDPKIMADMGIIYNGEGVRNQLTDPYNHYNGKIGIEVRGQSSQMFPMKSYGLELWDIDGKSVEKALFGLPKESDWVLYAPYTDKTLMRNFLAYTISREMGHWASNCRFVEVVVDGDYKGIYVFMEKIKRGSGRLNIAKMAATDISGDAVTGGYIFSLDKQPDGWFSSYSTPRSPDGGKRQFSYVYPKLSNIVQAQKDYIKSYVDSFENALASADYQDPQKGVRRFADIPSFVDFFIVNEISRNVDGYRLSSYFHKDRDSRNSKIFAGPVWDFDLAFHNAEYCDGWKTTGWAYEFNNVCAEDGAGLIPFWWNRFVKDTGFNATLRCRWKQLRETSLSDQRLNFLIDSIVGVTAEARERHFHRWPVLGEYIWPNPQPIPSDYAGEINSLKSWLAQRVEWITANMPNEGSCFDYPASLTRSVIIRAYPNPIGSQVMMVVKSRYSQALHIQVTDATGRRVSDKTFSLNSGQSNLVLPAASWASGIYFLTYRSANDDSGIIHLVK